MQLREKKHLSINANSSTDTTGGWTKNTQKPDFFFEKWKKNHPKRKKPITGSLASPSLLGSLWKRLMCTMRLLAKL